MRELDERLGLNQLIEEHLTDDRRGKYTQLPLPDLRASRFTAAWPDTKT